MGNQFTENSIEQVSIEFNKNKQDDEMLKLCDELKSIEKNRSISNDIKKEDAFHQWDVSIEK